MALILTSEGDVSVTLPRAAMFTIWVVLPVALGLLIGLAVLLYVRSALRREHAIEAVERTRAEVRFRDRLLAPDAAAFEARYGCPPGAALRALMRDAAVLLSEAPLVHVPGRSEPMEVAWFLPMDAEQLAEPPRPGCDALYAFATNGTGSHYLVAPCEDDPEVCYFDHTTGRCDTLGVRLSAFVQLPRSRA